MKIRYDVIRYFLHHLLREKCPYSEFSRIRTEYADLQGKSGKCGKIRTRKTPNTDTFCTVTEKPQNTPPNTDTDEPN